LAVLSDPSSPEGNAYYEIDAGQILVEMVATGEARASGRLLLTTEEVERLQRAYGRVDPDTKAVKGRRLRVPPYCWLDEDSKGKLRPAGPVWKPIWVWDWGRAEAPTEFQIRALERQTHCPFNVELRATLIDVYGQATKNNVPFADLIYQKI